MSVLTSSDIRVLLESLEYKKQGIRDRQLIGEGDVRRQELDARNRALQEVDILQEKLRAIRNSLE